MHPRLVERKIDNLEQNKKDSKLWAYSRYPDQFWIKELNRDVRHSYRTQPAAEVMWGPLVLCKSWRTGWKRAELANVDSVYGKGYSVKVTPKKGAADCSVWGMWEVELSKPGAPTIRATACDFQSGSDMPVTEDFLDSDFFTIWF